MPAPVGCANCEAGDDPVWLSPIAAHVLIWDATVLLGTIDGIADALPASPIVAQLARPAAQLRARLRAIGALSPEGKPQ